MGIQIRKPDHWCFIIKSSFLHEMFKILLSNINKWQCEGKYTKCKYRNCVCKKYCMIDKSLPWEHQTTTSLHSECVLVCSQPQEPCTQSCHRKNRLFCHDRWLPYLDQSLNKNAKIQNPKRDTNRQKKQITALLCWMHLPVIFMCPSSSRRILMGQQHKNPIWA